jgi:8-oxo-dGTP pyrophosphatase MutT (NUDIX family)
MEIIRPQSKQPIPGNAKKVFSGVLFDVYQWEQKMFDGSTATFEKLKRPDTVVVFPVMDDGRIILTEQEQPGRTSGFIGAAGGRVDAGEETLAAAKRELLEETGHTAERFIVWDAQQPTSKIEWAVYSLIAKGLKKVSDLKLDAGEKIKLKPVTFDEFINIATTMYFAEKEIVIKIMEAKLDPKKMEALRALFNPRT